MEDCGVLTDFGGITVYDHHEIVSEVNTFFENNLTELPAGYSSWEEASGAENPNVTTMVDRLQ